MTEPTTKPARRNRAAAAPTAGSPRQKRAARRGAANPAQGAAAAAQPSTRRKAAADPATPKGPSGKLGIVVALMRRPEGATVAQMGEATGWQPHSVRGALAGALKRKHKLTIVGQPGESGRVYRIAAEQPA